MMPNSVHADAKLNLEGGGEMLSDPLADLDPQEFANRMRFELLANVVDIAVVTLGGLALMAGLHWPVVVLAGLHLVAGMSMSLNKLLWLLMEAVVLTAGMLGIGWASRGLSTVGIDFLSTFFVGTPLIVQGAAACLLLALVLQAFGAIGAYQAAAELEVLKRRRRTT